MGDITLIHYLAAFCLSFIYVFFKATQQINVLHQQYKAILPVSYAMAFCEAATVYIIVETSLWVAFFLGTGAGLGAMLSMHLIGRKFHNSGTGNGNDD